MRSGRRGDERVSGGDMGNSRRKGKQKKDYLTDLSRGPAYYSGIVRRGDDGVDDGGDDDVGSTEGNEERHENEFEENKEVGNEEKHMDTLGSPVHSSVGGSPRAVSRSPQSTDGSPLSTSRDGTAIFPLPGGDLKKEIEKLSPFVDEYSPKSVVIDSYLKSFIPDFIPSVDGLFSFHNFVTIPPPDRRKGYLGTKMVDEQSLTYVEAPTVHVEASERNNQVKKDVYTKRQEAVRQRKVALGMDDIDIDKNFVQPFFGGTSIESMLKDLSAQAARRPVQLPTIPEKTKSEDHAREELEKAKKRASDAQNRENDAQGKLEDAKRTAEEFERREMELRAESERWREMAKRIKQQEEESRQKLEVAKTKAELSLKYEQEVRQRAMEAKERAEKEMKKAFQQKRRMQQVMMKELEEWKDKLKKEQQARIELEESKKRLERDFAKLRNRLERRWEDEDKRRDKTVLMQKPEPPPPRPEPKGPSPKSKLMEMEARARIEDRLYDLSPSDSDDKKGSKNIWRPSSFYPRDLSLEKGTGVDYAALLRSKNYKDPTISTLLKMSPEQMKKTVTEKKKMQKGGMQRRKGDYEPWKGSQSAHRNMYGSGGRKRAEMYAQSPSSREDLLRSAYGVGHSLKLPSLPRVRAVQEVENGGGAQSARMPHPAPWGSPSVRRPRRSGEQRRRRNGDRGMEMDFLYKYMAQ